MTEIGIVGGGRAATLHAEAIRATRGATIAGITTRRLSTPAPLAAAMNARDLPLAELVAASDGLVVAVPPAATEEVLAEIPRKMPVLVESPRLRNPADERAGAMTAANLLHAPTVAAGLQAIARLDDVHHLVLRGHGPRPAWGDHGSAAWGGGVTVDPHSATIPVLLAAAGTPVAGVRGSRRGPIGLETSVRLGLELADGRVAHVELEWDDGLATEVELEAAGSSGVVSIGLHPTPRLEIDGRPSGRADRPGDETDVLTALGFVEQMARFVGVVRGDRSAWPPLTVGGAVWAISAAVADLPEG